MKQLFARFNRSLKMRVWRWAYRAGYSIRRNEFNAYPDQARLLAGTEVSCIFDVGANGGDTVAEYQRLFPLAAIHAFEPIPHMLATLESRFGAQSRNRIVAAAVSDSQGSATFHINASADTSSLLETDLNHIPSAYREVQNAVSELTVSTVTLDHYCEQNSISRIDLLKLDIQGGELAALRGAQRLLDEHRVGVIYTEAFMMPFYKSQPLLGDIAQLLGKSGYLLHNLYNVSFSGTTGRCTWMDAIFVSPELAAKSRELLVNDLV